MARQTPFPTFLIVCVLQIFAMPIPHGEERRLSAGTAVILGSQLVTQNLLGFAVMMPAQLAGPGSSCTALSRNSPGSLYKGTDGEGRPLNNPSSTPRGSCGSSQAGLDPKRDGDWSALPSRDQQELGKSTEGLPATRQKARKG